MQQSTMVTVVFTDIVGSTQLLSRLGESAFDDLRRQHFAELRVVIAQYGGLVDADTAASYTVKRFRALPAPMGGDTPWSEVRLEPDNRAFEPIVVRGERLHDLSIVAELVEVLRASGGDEAP